MFVTGPDDGVTARRNELRLQADPIKLVYQPVSAFDQLFLKLVIG